MGKRLSLRRDSTLKLFAARMAGARYSMAFWAMASASLAQAAARVRLTTPKTLFSASKAPSMSAASLCGST